MKKLLFITAILSAAGCSHNKDANTPPPPSGTYSMERSKDGPLVQEETQVIETVARGEKRDIKKRWITLKNSAGQSISFRVSPQVKRLAELKVGDDVVTRYVESLAFEVREPTALERANPRTVIGAAVKAGQTLPPGIAAGTATHTIVEVTGLNLEENTALIKLPEGNTVTIRARYPENLRRVSVGDTIAVTYVAALAVAIEPVTKN